MNNGRNRLIFWLAGVVMTLIILALTTIGNAVVENDREGRKRDSDIRSEIHKVQLENRDRFEKIMIEITKLNTNLEKNGR